MLQIIHRFADSLFTLFTECFFSLFPFLLLFFLGRGGFSCCFSIWFFFVRFIHLVFPTSSPPPLRRLPPTVHSFLFFIFYNHTYSIFSSPKVVFLFGFLFSLGFISTRHFCIFFFIVSLVIIFLFMQTFFFSFL